MQNVHKKKSPVFVVNPQIIIDELPYLEINAGGQLVLYAGGEEGVGGRFLPLPAPGHAHQLLFVSSVADPNPVGCLGRSGCIRIPSIKNDVLFASI